MFAVLVFAAVGVLGFATNPFHSAYGIKADKPFSSKIISAFSALLAVGGLIGWTGAVAYWGTMAGAATKVGGAFGGGDKTVPCKRGCYMTIITGCVAMVVGAAFVMLYLNSEDWTQAKQPDVASEADTPAAGEDVASTPETEVEESAPEEEEGWGAWRLQRLAFWRTEDPPEEEEMRAENATTPTEEEEV